MIEKSYQTTLYIKIRIGYRASVGWAINTHAVDKSVLYKNFRQAETILFVTVGSNCPLYSVFSLSGCLKHMQNNALLSFQAAH